jgi:CelD/BcsL family acetyltransferase involved in cellulose biosynthesis
MSETRAGAGESPPLDPSRLEVLEINSIDSALEFGPQWQVALRETKNPSFFQSLDWLAVYWQHFGEGQRLRLLMTFEGDRLVGVLPWTIRMEPSRIGPFRLLGYPLDNWGTSFGPIGRDPEAILTAGLRWLQRTRKDWDVLDLRWAAEENAEATSRALARGGFSAERTPFNEISFINLNQTWEAYLGTRTRKGRKNIRQARNRLAEFGEVESIHCRPKGEDPRWDVYSMCERAAKASWQGSSTTGNTLTHTRVRDFLRDAHRAAVRSGCVSMDLVTVGGSPAAFTYCYVVQGHVLGLRMGYVGRFSRASPGTVMMTELLKSCIRQGDRRLDMGETPAEYKAQWRTSAGQSHRFTHYRGSSWRGLALGLKRKVDRKLGR